MRSRIARASSSESVRSGDWKTTRSATDFLPSGIWLAAVDVEDARLAQLGAGGLARGRDEVAREHVLVDDEGEILAHRRVTDDVLVRDPLGTPSEELVEVELEHAPRALEQRRVELAEPARLERARPCPDGGTAFCVRSTGGSMPQRLVAASRPRPSRARSRPRAIPPTCQRSSGSCSPDGR